MILVWLSKEKPQIKKIYFTKRILSVFLKMLKKLGTGIQFVKEQSPEVQLCGSRLHSAHVGSALIKLVQALSARTVTGTTGSSTRSTPPFPPRTSPNQACSPAFRLLSLSNPSRPPSVHSHQLPPGLTLSLLGHCHLLISC